MSGFDLQERLVADGVHHPDYFHHGPRRRPDARACQTVRSGWVPVKTVRRSGSARPHTEGNLPGLTGRSYS